MAIQFFTSENAELFKERLCNIQATDEPIYGEMTPTKMMRHLRFVFDLSLGKENAEDISTFFSRNIMRVLAFHWFTNWPGGKIKAPDYFTPESDQEFEQERDALFATIQEFIDQADQFPEKKTLSPLFGMLTLEYWRRLHGVHINHHCKQFGV